MAHFKPSIPVYGLLALALIISGHAQAGEGVVNGVKFRDIPTGSAISVEALDNSDINLKLAREFEGALAKQGYRVTSGADLILTFEVRDLRGSWKGGDPNRWLEFSNNEDHTGTEAPQVRLKLLETNKGGLLNREKPRGVRQVAPSQQRIDASVESRTDGKRLWQGWSASDIGATDSVSHARTMVPALVEAVGKTVRRQKVTLE